MTTFQELYQTLLEASLKDNLPDAIRAIEEAKDFDPSHLDCLLHPQNYPPIWRIGDCDCSDGDCASAKSCPFDAIHPDESGPFAIDLTRCVGCTTCIDNCRSQKLTASRDILPALKAVREHKGPVYALIAPAFHGQFSHAVTPGKLRSAFYKLGFQGMVEVALFADILTLKESLEFDKNIQKEGDFQLTSCCCPIWITLIRKIYHDLVPNLPASVSPMIAAGRAVKELHPEALTIFIGPCIAKKAEARDPELSGAVDYVLTFQEVQDIFEAAEINPADMEDIEKDHSSRAGRIYARVGGVSEAVAGTLHRINPHRKIDIKTKKADGVPACKELINAVLSGNIDANFYEGMGCVGGCVGGPKRIIPTEEGFNNVVAYGDDAAAPTPIDNPYVIKLLEMLGFKTIESLLEHSKIFTRSL